MGSDGSIREALPKFLSSEDAQYEATVQDSGAGSLRGVWLLGEKYTGVIILTFSGVIKVRNWACFLQPIRRDFDKRKIMRPGTVPQTDSRKWGLGASTESSEGYPSQLHTDGLVFVKDTLHKGLVLKGKGEGPNPYLTQAGLSCSLGLSKSEGWGV